VNLRLLLLGCLLAGLMSQPLRAQPVVVPGGQQEALQWLQRVALSASKQSYSGTFVYRNGGKTETSRIVHVAGNGDPRGKIVVLDGTPRELIRRKDEVVCYLPESRVVIVEQRASGRMSPALLPTTLAGLGAHYQIRKLGGARIAGFDSLMVRLDPRDPWRYGHQFWVEKRTGLLLKTEVFNARGEVLESMLFTEMRIGPPASAEQLNPTHTREGWQVRQARLSEIRDDGGWQFGSELPGFRKQAAMRRHYAHGLAQEEREVLHWVFTDGLAAISVFVSPLRKTPLPEETEARSMGVTSIIKRVVGDRLIVVMGDVPPETASRLASGITVRPK